jgi:hypothetical protein
MGAEATWTVLPEAQLLPGQAQRYKKISLLIGYLQILIWILWGVLCFLLFKIAGAGIYVTLLVIILSPTPYLLYNNKRLVRFHNKTHLLAARWLAQLTCKHWIHFDASDFSDFNTADYIPELTISGLVDCPTCGELRLFNKNFKLNNPDNWDW